MIDKLIEFSDKKHALTRGDNKCEGSYSRRGHQLLASKFLTQPYELTDKQKELCAKIEVATSCMNRIEPLLYAVNTWRKFPFKKIHIVDWTSKEPVTEALKRAGIEDDRINVIRFEGKKYYEHAICRNEKIKACSEDCWVLSIDADVMLTPLFLHNILMENDNVVYMNNKTYVNKALYGTSLCKKHVIDRVGGCDERIHGWGLEDTDLFENIIRLGCKVRPFGGYTMYHQPHNDNERAIHTKYDTIYKSFVANNMLKAMRWEM